MFTKKIKDVLNELEVDKEFGIDSSSVEQRKKIYGNNELIKGKKKTVLDMFVEQLKDPMVLILFVAIIISLFLKEYFDALVILVVIVINAVIGVMQEFKAEKALEALEKMSTPKAIVKRDGHIKEIDSQDIVVGDIVYLEAGRYVGCDLRLIETNNLKIEESALTGESLPVEKDCQVVLANENVPLGDRKNMAYMSTYATYGRGVGVAVNVGMNTEIGKIAKMLDEAENTMTPLQIKLASLGKLLGLLSIGICVLMFGIALWQGRDLIEMLLTAISLAVAAIPEGLPAVVTIVLALGVQRMSKKNAIVRKLHSVETLGNVNVICSDKTGTLTQNKMTVVKAFCNNQLLEVEDSKSYQQLAKGLVLCNDTIVEDGKLIGDPTETALVAYGTKIGIDKKDLEMKYPRVDEIPFESDRKLMTTVHKVENGYVVYTKGAVDRLLDKCNYILLDGSEQSLNEVSKRNIAAAVKNMASNAYRVLALAYKNVNNLNNKDYEANLVFVGLIGMIDPPREEVKDAIAICHHANIKVVMITGDHQDTAYAIAKQLKIASSIDQVKTGAQIDDLSLEEINNTSVFARVSPEHKVKIVTSLQKQGYVVAMTGDGVNDAPSLKSADVGIAMGITGTDVSKSASDIILTDDNFASIVKAVEEGRNIYLNIKKSVLYLLSCNLGEIAALFFAILLRPDWAAPLIPIQILWVNLITDAFPALALGVDVLDPSVMDEKPRKKDESLFAHGGWSFLIVNGLIIGFMTIFAYRIGLESSPNVNYAHTMAFMQLSIIQLFHAFNLRSSKESIFKVGVFKNKWLLLSFAVGVLIQVGVTFIPLFNLILKTTPLSLMHWGVIFGQSLMIIVISELYKLLVVRTQKHQ